MRSAHTVTDHRERIRRVVIYLNRQLDKKIRLDRLAKLACFSPFHFIRVFESIMGETPQQYLIRKRMERAGFNLLRHDWSVTDVAFSVSYETPSSFCKIFKNVFRISPRQFRDITSEKEYYKAHHPFRFFGDKQKYSRSVPVPVIKNLPPLKVIYIENRGAKEGNFLATASASFRQFKKEIARQNLESMVHAQVSIYPFRPLTFDDKQVLNYVGAIVHREKKSLPGLKYTTFPSGRYAIFNHFGSYKFMPQTWNQAYMNWLPQSGRQLRDAPPMEIHLDTGSNPDSFQLKAYLMIPIL